MAVTGSQLFMHGFESADCYHDAYLEYRYSTTRPMHVPVGVPKSMHDLLAACYGHRLSFTEGKTVKSPASVTASWTALLEKRDGS